MNSPTPLSFSLPESHSFPAKDSRLEGQFPADIVPQNALSSPGFFWLDDGRQTADIPSNPSSQWSFLGAVPVEVLTYKSNQWELFQANKLTKQWNEDFNTYFKTLTASSSTEGTPSKTTPPFAGGWLACLSYDLGREFEKLPEQAKDDLKFPDAYFGLYDFVLSFDHINQQWWGSGLFSKNTIKEKAQDDLIHKTSAFLDHLLSNNNEASYFPPVSITSNFEKVKYLKTIQRILEYIAAGDAYQVNLAQRFSTDWSKSGISLYNSLRSKSPAQFGTFWNLHHIHPNSCLAGISPELFLKLNNNEITTRPIKGTRPRGKTPEGDKALRAELEQSKKDAAELAMIVDLERNDLGRVSEYGSVVVESRGTIETHPTVFHRSAVIKSKLRNECDLADLITATFPGGSVTGAPKIRAMEIIDELEPTRRGAYCGGIGWIGIDGSMELNLPIRTAYLDGASKTVHYYAGGGIVADSKPMDEYEETLHKAEAFFKSINGTFNQL